MKRLAFSLSLLTAAGLTATVYGDVRQGIPRYSVTATIPLGLQPYTDLDANPETGRVYLAFRDGLRVVDTKTGTIGPHQKQLETSGAIELAPDIDRIFAEIDDVSIGFIDMRSYHLDRAVPIEFPGTLFYEPRTEELYVFSLHSPEVRIFDGRTGDQKRTLDLPGWGGVGVLKTPGRIYVNVPPKVGLYVIDTAERRVTRFPMPPGIDLPSNRFTLVANASGSRLFASDDHEIVAIDAETGARIARVVTNRDGAALAYDPVADVLLARVGSVDWQQGVLASFRLDGSRLLPVATQTLPVEGGGIPFVTGAGFVSGYFKGSLDGEQMATPPFSKSYVSVWERDRASR
jgi:DNA-binding beta-propeller fold protein YncE